MLPEDLLEATLLCILSCLGHALVYFALATKMDELLCAFEAPPRDFILLFKSFLKSFFVCSKKVLLFFLF